VTPAPSKAAVSDVALSAARYERKAYWAKRAASGPRYQRVGTATRAASATPAGRPLVAAAPSPTALERSTAARRKTPLVAAPVAAPRPDGWMLATRAEGSHPSACLTPAW
jgi:hypothetical protein